MIKLPKGVTVHGISGKPYRGEIPVADCHDCHAEKYAPKTPVKSQSSKKPDTVGAG